MICMQLVLFSITNTSYADTLQRKGKDFEIPTHCITFAYSAVLHFPWDRGNFKILHSTKAWAEINNTVSRSLLCLAHLLCQHCKYWVFKVMTLVTLNQSACERERTTINATRPFFYIFFIAITGFQLLTTNLLHYIKFSLHCGSYGEEKYSHKLSHKVFCSLLQPQTQRKDYCKNPVWFCFTYSHNSQLNWNKQDRQQMWKSMLQDPY